MTRGEKRRAIARPEVLAFMQWADQQYQLLASERGFLRVSARPSPGRFSGWLRSTSRTARRIAQAEVVANGENE